MKQCQYCFQQIDARASVCQFCRRDQRPERRFWPKFVLVGVAIIAVLIAVLPSSPKPPEAARPIDPYRHAETAINHLYSGRCGDVVALRPDQNAGNGEVATCSNGRRFLVSRESGNIRVTPL